MNLGRLNNAREAEGKAPIKHSLDIWHVAKNLAKKIAKVVLLFMYCRKELHQTKRIADILIYGIALFINAF